MSARRLLNIIAYTVLAVTTVGFVLAHLKPQWWFARESVVVVERTAPEATPSSDKDFRRAARAGLEAVVAVLPDAQAPQPLERLLPPNHPSLPEGLPSEMGSGVVVSDDGLIVTNAHVVEKNDTVTVRFANRFEAAARVIGRDPETDLAVLRLGELPQGGVAPLPLAPDDSYAVGDVVLAVGYPFGVGQTVTMGIISALDRTELGISTFEQFIQTDAAINPGNSGGALIDTQGRLVGINTAIFSQTGGNLGIGFAIPGRVVRPVIAALVQDGQVRRGWLGVQLEPLPARQSTALGGAPGTGVVVAAVLPGSPAEKAGVAPGDVIMAINGNAITSIREALDRVAATPPGKALTLELQRNGRQITLHTIAGERPPLTD
ncbi:Do family serine endopeptidase [Hydrogenophilus islandicus]